MYCKKCGCRLDSSAGVCPECGSGTTTEYCGGFWGIINEKGGNAVPGPAELPSAAPEYREVQAAPIAEDAAGRDLMGGETASPSADQPAPAEQSAGRPFGSGRALSVLLALALICALVQTARLAVRPRREEVRELKSQIEQLEEEQEIKDEVIEKLKSKNKKLMSKYKALKEQYGADTVTEEPAGEPDAFDGGSEAEQKNETDGGQAVQEPGNNDGQGLEESGEQS